MTQNSDKKIFFRKSTLIAIAIIGGSILTGTILIPHVVGNYKENKNQMIYDNFWGKNASDVTSINVKSNGECKWGTNGNQCMTVGEYLNWCVSAPRNGVTENPLDFCIEVMTGKDLKQHYQGIPYTEQIYANGSKFYLINGTFVPSDIVETIVKELTK